MTKQQAIKRIKSEMGWESEELNREAFEMGIKALEEVQQYRALGTVEELKALKEKDEPMELAEHNFQDEVHYYLCPMCRSIVNYGQNYCEECGQRLGE